MLGVRSYVRGQVLLGVAGGSVSILQSAVLGVNMGAGPARGLAGPLAHRLLLSTRQVVLSGLR